MENGNPISDLQQMLRDLGKVHEYLPSISIDGIFGANTLEAVILFQKHLFPPVTGVVTKEVWDAMGLETGKIQQNLSKPRVLRAFPEGRDALDFGEERGEIALFQTMFSLMSEKIIDIVPEEPSGIFTETLRKNVLWLQNISNLAETGQLNRITWDRLARLYEVYITGA